MAIGPKSLAEARAVLPRLARHFGLRQNRSGFGVRVPVPEVASAGKILNPNDSRFNDSNHHLAGRVRYLSYGLPDGTSRSEVSKLLHDKLKVPQVPALVGAVQRRGGHPVFPIAVDQTPAQDTFELRSGPVLLRPFLLSDRGAPRRVAARKAKVKPQTPSCAKAACSGPCDNCIRESCWPLCLSSH